MQDDTQGPHKKPSSEQEIRKSRIDINVSVNRTKKNRTMKPRTDPDATKQSAFEVARQQVEAVRLHGVEDQLKSPPMATTLRLPSLLDEDGKLKVPNSVKKAIAQNANKKSSSEQEESRGPNLDTSASVNKPRENETSRSAPESANAEKEPPPVILQAQSPSYDGTTKPAIESASEVLASMEKERQLKNALNTQATLTEHIRQFVTVTGPSVSTPFANDKGRTRGSDSILEITGKAVDIGTLATMPDPYEMPRSLNNHLAKIEGSALKNKKDSNRDTTRFWMLKAPAMIASAASGIFAYTRWDLPSLLLGGLGTLCMIIDAMNPSGALRNVHLRAYHDYNSLHDKITSKWSTDVPNLEFDRTHPDKYQKEKDKLAGKIIGDSQKEIDRIAKYVSNAETSLDTQRK